MIDAIQYIKAKNRAASVAPKIKDSTINFETLKDAGYSTFAMVQLSEEGALTIKYVPEPMISFKSFKDLVSRIKKLIAKSNEYIERRSVELQKFRDESKYSKAEKVADGIEMAKNRILSHECEISNVKDTYRCYLNDKINSHNQLIKSMKDITADFQSWNKFAEKELSEIEK